MDAASKENGWTLQRAMLGGGGACWAHLIDVTIHDRWVKVKRSGHAPEGVAGRQLCQ